MFTHCWEKCHDAIKSVSLEVSRRGEILERQRYWNDFLELNHHKEERSVPIEDTSLGIVESFWRDRHRCRYSTLWSGHLLKVLWLKRYLVMKETANPMGKNRTEKKGVWLKREENHPILFYLPSVFVVCRSFRNIRLHGWKPVDDSNPQPRANLRDEIFHNIILDWNKRVEVLLLSTRRLRAEIVKSRFQREDDWFDLASDQNESR